MSFIYIYFIIIVETLFLYTMQFKWNVTYNCVPSLLHIMCYSFDIIICISKSLFYGIFVNTKTATFVLLHTYLLNFTVYQAEVIYACRHVNHLSVHWCTSRKYNDIYSFEGSFGFNLFCLKCHSGYGICFQEYNKCYFDQGYFFDMKSGKSVFTFRKKTSDCILHRDYGTNLKVVSPQYHSY